MGKKEMILLILLATTGLLAIWAIAAYEIYRVYKMDKIKSSSSVSVQILAGSTEKVSREMTEFVLCGIFPRNILVNSSDKFDDKAHTKKYNRFITNRLTVKHIQNVGEVENV
jgi:hypothetical protein